MASHSSASMREHTPHVNRTSRTNTIVNALKRRAQAVLEDRSIDPKDRALIRYALEINDPWLAELVRRADAGESVIDAIENSQITETSDDDSIGERIEVLVRMICMAGDEPATRCAALLVLMATLENASHPKLLVNTIKHLAFGHCAELNLHGMVESEVEVLEEELFAEHPSVM